MVLGDFQKSVGAMGDGLVEMLALYNAVFLSGNLQ